MAVRQFAVIGLGRFGTAVARALAARGHEVLALDADADRVQQLADEFTRVLQVDATDVDPLRALGLRNFDVVVVAIGADIQSSILATLNCKELGCPLVVAKASSELHGKVLARIGADRVVFPERDMGERLAQSLMSNTILDYIDLSPEHTIMEVAAAGHLIGRTLRQLDLRARYGVNVMAMRKGDRIVVPPTADDVVEEGDILVVIGHNDGLRRLERGEGLT